MSKLIITKGLSGSGKSTWAHQQAGFTVVSKDDIRKQLEVEVEGWKWSQEAEKDVIKRQTDYILTELRAGRSVIAADTNFGKHEARLRNLAREVGAEFEIKDFTDTPLQTCLDRNKARSRDEYVPEDSIIDMYKKFVEPGLINRKPEPVKWVNGLPTAIIVDIDGTVALHVDRSPYDTAKCGTDRLNENVASVVWAMGLRGHEILFVSGREDKFRTETEDWLNKNGFPEPKVFMRKAGDFRNDAIIKTELFDQHIRGKYNVVVVLDDRDRTIKRWRELGLTALQVNYGNF